MSGAAGMSAVGGNGGEVVGGNAGDGSGGSGGGFGSGGSAGNGSGGSAGELVGGNAGMGMSGGVGGAAGSANAGAGVGGALTGGSAGAPEPPEYCSLPLEQGSCTAGDYAHGLDSDWGRCKLFYYGGCDGNANNFASFEACSNVCGWPDETGCPAKYPVEGEPCTELGHACDYGPDACSCQPVSESRCERVDPECESVAPPPDDPCSGEDCPAKVLAIYYLTCTCENSAWSCGVGSQG